MFKIFTVVTLRNALRLFSSTVVAQLAVLVATIVVAARLTSADFAAFGVVFALTLICSSLATLGVEARIAIASEDKVGSLQRASLVAICCLSLGLLMVAGAIIEVADTQVSSLICLAAVGTFAYSVQQISVALILRLGRPSVLARARVVQGGSNAGLILLLSFSPLVGYAALALAWIASVLLGILTTVLMIPGLVQIPGFKGLRVDFRVTWREVRQQPLTNILATLSDQLPLVVLPVVASTAIAGSWALSSRVFSAVTTAGFNTLQPIYYATAAQNMRERDFVSLRHWHGRWAIWLPISSIVLISLLGVVVTVGLPAISFEWQAVGLLIVPACLFWIAQFVYLPLSQTLLIGNQVLRQLLWTSVRLVVAISIFLIFSDDAVHAIWVWASFIFLSNAIHLILQRKMVTEYCRA